jgi:allophanate hydrolase
LASAGNFLGCRASEALFAVQRLTALGGVPVAIDFAPFLAAARLLYDGPWVAERYAVAGPLIEQQPDAVLPVIRDVLAKAPDIDATATFKAMYQLQGYKAQCDAILETLDCVLTPTVPRPVTLDERRWSPSPAMPTWATTPTL